MSWWRKLPPERVFAALGDPRRLRLVRRLATGGAHTIGGLSEGAGVSRQAVTRHLRVLEAAGLVLGVRSGREHLWVLHDPSIAAARAELIGLTRTWRRRPR